MSEPYMVFSDLALATLMVIAGIAVYKSWVSRRVANDWYKNHVTGYKVGLIVKQANANGIEILFPPNHDELIAKFEDDVEADLTS